MPTYTPVKNFWIKPPFEALTVDLTEFSFGYTEQNGKTRSYKVQRKGTEESRVALHEMLWEIRFAQKGSRTPDWKKLNKLKPLLNITNLDRDAEQLSLWACVNAIDSISDKLEAIGLFDKAYKMDIIANSLENGWLSNKANLFFDEISNQGVEPQDAQKVLDTARKYELKN